MKVLQLCKKYPYPTKDGETIAVTNLSAALSRLGCEVHGLVMNTTRHTGETGDHRPQYRSLRAVPVDNRIRPLDALRCLISGKSYHIARFESTDFNLALVELLQTYRFDIVQLETLYLAPYVATIRQYAPQARIVMRAHNVEHEIWQRIVQNSRFPKRWYLRQLTRQLEQYETEHLNDYDLLVPISRRDEQTFRHLGYRGAAQVTPIGIDLHSYRPDERSFLRPPSVSFIGSLDWMPNQEGLRWFLKRVWASVERELPQLRLHVAGRNTPEQWLRGRRASVEFLGEVDCARAFLNQHSLSVVPLLSGSGMRAKILEAMALGKVVVSTRIGLEGIDAQHRREVLIADTPEEFLQCFRFAVEHPQVIRKMGRRAREFALSHYDFLATGQELLNTYRKLCGMVEPVMSKIDR